MGITNYRNYKLLEELQIIEIVGITELDVEAQKLMLLSVK